MAFRPPPEFDRLLSSLARELGGAGLPFMLIGGQAVLLHGSARLTDDIDVTLGVDPAHLPAVVNVCAALRLTMLPDDVHDFVNRTFVLPAREQDTGIRVDFIFSSTVYEAQAIVRAQLVDIAGTSVPFATAEDLIIHKLFAGRARDIEDVAGVVRRKGAELDWTYLANWAREFASIPGREEMPAQVDRLRHRGNPNQ